MSGVEVCWGGVRGACVGCVRGVCVGRVCVAISFRGERRKKTNIFFFGVKVFSFFLCYFSKQGRKSERLFEVCV